MRNLPAPDSDGNYIVEATLSVEGNEATLTNLLGKTITEKDYVEKESLAPAGNIDLRPTDDILA